MNFEAKRQAHRTALRECNEACETGDVDKIKRLFGIDLNTSQGSTEKRAIQDGADHQILLGPDDALECLIWMIDEDDFRVSRCLLELGIIDLRQAPIRLLTKVKSHVMLELLADFGFDFAEYGHNILHNFLAPISTLKYLLDLGADPNRPVVPSLIPSLKRGETDDTIQCLNEAAAQGDMQAFELLASRGADSKKSIALHRVTRFKGTNERTVAAVIDYLIDVQGMDPNADDDCGGLRKLMTALPEEGTPLEYALANQNREAALALVKKGADPERICNKNKVDGVKRLIDGM